MTSTDPIADMLTRIRNAIAVQKHVITLPHSKIKLSIAEALKDHHYIESVSVIDGTVGKDIEITINGPQTSPKITEIKRLSTPGRRLYVKADAMPKVRQGRGIVLVSTSKGIMSGDNAKSKRLGGELLCEVY